MGKFTDFVKSFGNNSKSKRYFGLLSGGLPQNPQAWGDNSFLTANEVSLYTNKGISKRAEKVSEVQFILRDVRNEVVEDHPILDMLQKPNSVLTGRQFWTLYQKYRDLVGASYFLMDTNRGEREFGDKVKVKNLHLLKSDLVKPVQNKETGIIEKYEYQTKEKKIIYDAEEIIYLFNPDPKSPMSGQSLLQAGIQAIQTELQVSSYHARVIENGGKPEGAFKFKANLTEEQVKTNKTTYQKEYGNAKKSGMPLFLGGDVDYTRIGLTPDELSFLDTKRMTLEDISILTGVPKSILGSYDDIQFSNADTSVRVFLRETIKPLLGELVDALNCSPLIPEGFTLDFVDPTPENVDEELKKTESGVKNYYMTINEARERHGLEPIDNGDDIMIPFSVMPLGEERQTFTPPVEEEKPKEDEKEKSVKKKMVHPLQDKDVRKNYAKLMVKRMDSQEDRFAKVVDKYFKDQRVRLVEALDPTKQRVFRKKGLFDEIFNLEAEVKVAQEEFFPMLEALMIEAGEDAKAIIGSTFDFDITADVRSWIERRTNVFSRSINETTVAALATEFQASFDAGENRQQLINRVENTYGNISKKRAATIVRTEVHVATQFGTHQAYKQAGFGIKIWVAVLDGVTRDSHFALDGEERPIDVPFSNGLQFPADPSGPAEEVINCRCVI